MTVISASPCTNKKNLTLRKIFDKKITLLADKWSPYFDVYETFFSKYPDQKNRYRRARCTRWGFDANVEGLLW